MSIRKALTILTALLFAYCVIAYLYGKPEIPVGYQGIMYMVWALYFTKNFKLKEI